MSVRDRSRGVRQKRLSSSCHEQPPQPGTSAAITEQNEKSGHLRLMPDWERHLESCGFPPVIINRLRTIEFEEWTKHHFHKKGVGLYYGEFEDLPPRFQKKIQEAWVKLNCDLSSSSEPINKLDFSEVVEALNALSLESSGSKTQEDTAVEQLSSATDHKAVRQSSTKQEQSSLNVFSSDKHPSSVQTSDVTPYTADEVSFVNIAQAKSSQNSSHAHHSNSYNHRSKQSKDRDQRESSGNCCNKGVVEASHVPAVNASPNSECHECYHHKPDQGKQSSGLRISSKVVKRVPSFKTELPCRPKTTHKPVTDAIHNIPSDKGNSSRRFSNERCPPPPHYSAKRKRYSSSEGSDPLASCSGSSICQFETKCQEAARSDPNLAKILNLIDQKQRNSSGKEKSAISADSVSSNAAKGKTYHQRSSSHQTDFAVHAKSENIRTQGLNKKSRQDDIQGSCSLKGVLEDMYAMHIQVSAPKNYAYWHSYFERSLNHNEFLIELSSKHSLELIFLRDNMAKQAYQTLQQIKSTNRPHVVGVNKISKLDVDKLSAVSSCKRAIIQMHENALKEHRGKIGKMRQKLVTQMTKNHAEHSGTNKKDSCMQGEREVLSDNIELLEAMEKVFTNYKNRLINRLSSCDAENSSAISDLKNNFSRECNGLLAALPIYSKKEEILKLVETSQVSIVIAETGSGKSTQLIQYLWQAGYAEDGRIVCTQPRKIAAVSICNYISAQMGSETGELVGYETGVRAKVSKKTKLIYMTDYALLKRFVKSRLLDEISCIIVDEAHERSLFTDLLLGLLKSCIIKRKDLKVVITSATINPGVFLEYFGLPNSSVLDIPGRIYPVRVVWGRDLCISSNLDYVRNCVNCACDIFCSTEEGAILVFLTSPGEAERASALFMEKIQYLKEELQFEPMVLALHGRQDPDVQMKAFLPVHNKFRKVIFATNSAETSVTIPGIKYVVDCGLVRELQYDQEKKRSALVLTFVNRSSAEQRKGRAGRTQPGICYRMYSEYNYKHDMKPSAIPEILCSSLQRIVLKILEFNLNPEEFDFIDSPPKTAIEDAMYSLQQLGAVENERLTAVGKQMAKLPLEPQWSKFVIRGICEGMGYEAMVIAALMSLTGRIFFRNEENKDKADKALRKFSDERGDFHTFLNIFFRWKKFENVRERNLWCFQNCLNSKSMRTALNVVEDLCEVVQSELHLPFKNNLRNPSPQFYEKFDMILFECLSENLAIFSGHEKSGYFSPYHDDNFFIHPSSALCCLGKKSPEFVIYGTILKTSRNFLLNVSPISSQVIIDAYQRGKYEFQIDLLRRFQVVQKVIKPVGEIILVRYVLGKDGSRVKAIEKKISESIKSSAFYIDVNVKKGEIVLHMEQQHLTAACRVIEQVIEEGRLSLVKEQQLCSASAPFKFLLGCGGLVRDVILPGESSEIVLEHKTKKRCIKESEVLPLLEKYGPLSSCVLDEDSTKLYATYEKVEYAENALKGFERGGLYMCTPKIHLREVTDRNLPLFRVSVSWCRLYCTGTGFIDFFDSADCIEASYKLRIQSVCVDNKCIIVEPVSHGGCTLRMRNLPEGAEEHAIMEAVRQNLPPHLRVKNVMVMRQEPHQSSPIDMGLAKKKLEDLFKPFVDPSKLVIKLETPQPSDIMWNAMVYFTDFEDGEKALSVLKNSAKIGQFTAKLSGVFSCSVHCQKDIYKVIEKDVRYCLSEFKRKGECTDFQVKLTPPGVHVILKCQNIRHLTKVRQEVTRLMRGVHMTCSEDPKLLYLFSKDDEISFQSIERETKTVIRVNAIRKVISIYGNPRACERAQVEITCLSENSILLKTKVYDIRDSEIPHGFLKAVYKKFGHDLSGLTRHFRLKDAYFSVVRHQLVIQGSPRRIKEAEDCLEKICAELSKDQEDTRQTPSEEKDLCPVCFDEISGDCVRLENCGHVVCKPCLLLYVKADVFPVVCVQKDCSKPFFLEDLLKVFSGSHQLKSQFCKQALEHFVRRNTTKVQYCLTPDCSMLYRVKSRQRKFKCPVCENEICTWCHSFYHHGMTCEMYQQIKVDEDYSLKVWMKEEGLNRKVCPKCSMAIEKDGGCNHVHCTNCDTHICWLCMHCFRSSDDVYEHIPFCPHNIV